MYRPNSIQSRLAPKEEDSGALLNEVNDTIESLRKWKEEQKRLDEELEQKILESKNKKVELYEEETSTDIELKERDIKNIRCLQKELIDVGNPSQHSLLVIPDYKDVNNYDLYKTGNQLNEMLNDWNSSLEYLSANQKAHGNPGEEWNQIKEIEKELEELEELMDSAPNLDD
jgi:hypothetical protein